MWGRGGRGTRKDDGGRGGGGGGSRSSDNDMMEYDYSPIWYEVLRAAPLPSTRSSGRENQLSTGICIHATRVKLTLL